MPANSSIILFINIDAAPCLKYSPKKMEMGREKTIEMIRAKKEVARVPTRKARAPNSPLTGSHVVPARNLRPKCRMAGREENNSEKKIATRRISTKIAAR
jgi:hypothetical protein